ncbi:MAG: hypothetical protein V3R30_05250 [Kiloniellales bacterium]
MPAIDQQNGAGSTLASMQVFVGQPLGDLDGVERRALAPQRLS